MAGGLLVGGRLEAVELQRAVVLHFENAVGQPGMRVWRDLQDAPPDTSSPAMNILLKRMAVVSVVFAPLILAAHQWLVGLFCPTRD